MSMEHLVETYIQRGNLPFSVSKPLILTDIGSLEFEFAMYCPLTRNYEVVTLNYYGYYSTSYCIEIPYLKIELMFDYLRSLLRCLKSLMNDKRTWIICQMLSRLNYRLRRELTREYFYYETQNTGEIIQSFIRSSKRQKDKELKERIEICERYLQYDLPEIERNLIHNALSYMKRKVTLPRLMDS